MKPAPRVRCGIALALLLAATAAAGAEEYSFDASAFEKKAIEIGGHVQLKQEGLSLNRAGAFYKLGTLGLPQRDTLDRTTATLELSGKLRPGAGTFDFRTYSSANRDPWQRDNVNAIYEAAYSVRPDPGLTLEAGKRVLRWGKGYAWNPVGFVERPKDPNDPQLAREGYWMANADWIVNREGALQTLALTPAIVPVGNEVNSDLGASGHLNPAAKLYLLYRDTDIDFMWQGKGSRPARFGADFSRNITSNFEIHGEWARIEKFTRQTTTAGGSVASTLGNATSYLLGLRYLTQGDTTYIAEYYRNGSGYSEQEASQFYQLVNTTFAQIQQTGSSPLLKKAQALGQGSYGRPNAGEQYLYLRAQQKDAFGIVYFQPAITAMVNLEDRSFQVTPEFLYTGVNNLELRLKAFVLKGGASTDFGEKQSSRRIEVYARYYF
jgi:hypothetical protein